MKKQAKEEKLTSKEISKENNSSASEETSLFTGAIKIGITSETPMKKPKIKEDPLEDEWDEDYKAYLESLDLIGDRL